MKKNCPRCNQLAEFRIQPKTGKTKGYCNACEVKITREWRQRPENAERLRARKRAIAEVSPDFYKKEYWNNRESRLAATKKCNARHASERREYRRKQLEIPENRLRHNMRARLREILTKQKTIKFAKTRELIGCDWKELRAYLSSMFRAGMSWENYGEWHIDHVKPCASFNLLNATEQRACFHYSNLQPLWAHENRAKGDSLNSAKISIS